MDGCSELCPRFRTRSARSAVALFRPLIVLLALVCTACQRPATYSAPYEAERLNDRQPIIEQAHFAELGVPEEGSNLNGPSLIRIPGWIPPAERADPSAVYYLYFAHHRGDYIRLAWATDLTGPWTLFDVGAEVAIGERGVLDLGPDDAILLGNGLTVENHIASPDVFVDDDRKRIVMYFHAPVDAPSFRGQQTLVAVSRDGLDFQDGIEPVFLGKPYFRVFTFDGELHAVANRGNVYRALDPADPWTPPDDFDFGSALWQWQGNPLPKNLVLPYYLTRPRHSAVRVVDDEVHVFLSRIGDLPERIRFVTLKPDGDGGWIASDPPVELLVAEPGWECGELPPVPSRGGKAPEAANQLRDPAYFEDKDGLMYLLYSGCGEDAIGLAALSPRPAAP
jgi:hypothetical protein